MLSYFIRVIPNLFSLGNLLSGVFSITFAMNGYYKMASLLIFFSAFLDLFDGRLARKLKVSNQVGVELDSLADVVSFGVAPAILFYTLADPGFLTTLAFVLYPTMGALRLARFNANPTVGYFLRHPNYVCRTNHGVDDVIFLYKFFNNHCIGLTYGKPI